MDLISRYARLQAFIEKRLKEDIYPEPIGEPHLSITTKVIGEYNNEIGLQNKYVLDVGCGQGLALEQFKALGAIAQGITFGEDLLVCKRKGLDVEEMDMSFLEFSEGAFDLIWARHVLEHSLFPFFTLDGFYRVLRPGGAIYVEVPAPDTSAHHETNKNHYSCLTRSTWLELFKRTGFQVVAAFDYKINVPCGPDIYWAFKLKK